MRPLFSCNLTTKKLKSTKSFLNQCLRNLKSYIKKCVIWNQNESSVSFIFASYLCQHIPSYMYEHRCLNFNVISRLQKYENEQNTA